MNNHHKIISVHSVSRLKYEGDFFPKKAIHGKANFFGQICRRGLFYMGGIMIIFMLSGEWGERAIYK